MTTTPRRFAEKTKVPSAQTRMEIERLLERHKAKQYLTGVDYEHGTARVQFNIHSRIVRFTVALPDQKKLGGGDRYAQAERQKWRALMLVIKAKLESVENEIATFEEEFLAHIVMPNDQTVADVVLPLVAFAYERGTMPPRLLLTEGDR